MSGSSAELRAMAIGVADFQMGPFNNRLYVAYGKANPGEAEARRLVLRAFEPMGAGIITFNDVWNTEQTFYSSVGAEINDLAVHRDLIAVTGFFRNNFTFEPFPPAFMASSGSLNEAFVMTIDDDGPDPSYEFGREMKNAGSAQTSVGNGIAIDGSRVYMVGSYIGAEDDVFGSTEDLAAAPVPGASAAFVASINFGGGLLNLANISATGTACEARNVEVRGGRLYISGDFWGNGLLYDNTILAGTYLYGNHEFVCRWSRNNFYATSGEWMNASVLQHTVRNGGLTFNNDNVFTSGRYRGDMEMDDMSGATTGISSSGTGNNAYVWRFNRNTGLARTPVAEAPETLPAASEIAKEVAKPELTVFPNPSRGEFQVKASGLDANTAFTVQVVDLFGRIVLEQNFSGSGPHTIAETLAAGTYLVKLRTPNYEQHETLIISK